MIAEGREAVGAERRGRQGPDVPASTGRRSVAPPTLLGDRHPGLGVDRASAVRGIRPGRDVVPPRPVLDVPAGRGQQDRPAALRPRAQDAVDVLEQGGHAGRGGRGEARPRHRLAVGGDARAVGRDLRQLPIAMWAGRVAEDRIAGHRRGRVVVAADRERVESLVVDELVLGRRDGVRVAQPEVPGGLEDGGIGPVERQPVLEQVVGLEPGAARLGGSVEALADDRAALVAGRPAQGVDPARVGRIEIAVGGVAVWHVRLRVLDDRRGQTGVGAGARRGREPAPEGQVGQHAGTRLPDRDADPGTVEAGGVGAIGARGRDRITQVEELGRVVEVDDADGVIAGKVAKLGDRGRGVHDRDVVVRPVRLCDLDARPLEGRLQPARGLAGRRDHLPLAVGRLEETPVARLLVRRRRQFQPRPDHDREAVAVLRTFEPGPQGLIEPPELLGSATRDASQQLVDVDRSSHPRRMRAGPADRPCARPP